MRRSLAIVVAAAAVMVLAAPAAAKGPEGATLSGPGLDGEVELFRGDQGAAAVMLMEQTGLWYGIGDLPIPRSAPPPHLGARYELTWLAFGPPGADQLRRQYLYVPDGDGLIVIYTPEQPELGEWGRHGVGWHTAPEGLRTTLAELGLPRFDPGRVVGRALGRWRPV